MSNPARAVIGSMLLGLAWLANPLLSVTTADAGPALLLEADTGRVLYAEDQDHQWYPASVTKIMTAYLVFDAIKSGRLSMTDMVTVSDNAHVQPPSKLGLPVGGEIPVELALRILIVKSANDVAVMLAEKVAGSEEKFAALMNDTAKRLGMSRTHFINPHGLPVPGQVSTARDLARLARAVLRDFPEHQAMWTLAEVRVGRHRLRSHNHLLKSFEGADGLKTGFICDSGYNVVASATRDGKRLLAVVLGEPTGRDRALRAAGLLDHGFETAAWKADQGARSIDTLPIDARAEAVTSVRATVASWSCNPRRVAVRKVARKRAQAAAERKAARTKSAQAGDTTTPATTSAAPTAAKPATPAAPRKSAEPAKPASTKQ